MTQTPTSPQRIVTSEMYPPLYRAAMEIDSPPASSARARSSEWTSPASTEYSAPRSTEQRHYGAPPHTASYSSPAPAAASGSAAARRPISLYEATRNETVSSSPVLSSSPMFDVIDAPATGNTPLFDDVRQSVARDRIRVVPSDERASRVDTLIEPPRRDAGFAAEPAGYDPAPLPSRRSREQQRDSQVDHTRGHDTRGHDAGGTGWAAQGHSASPPPHSRLSPPPHTVPAVRESAPSVRDSAPAARQVALSEQLLAPAQEQVSWGGMATPATGQVAATPGHVAPAPSAPLHPMTSGFARIADPTPPTPRRSDRGGNGGGFAGGLRAHVGTGSLPRTETPEVGVHTADPLLRASTPGQQESLRRGPGRTPEVRSAPAAPVQAATASQPTLSVTCTQGIPIMGGRMGNGVLRYGDCVRHVWSDTASPAVEVLRALDAVGFPSAPRVVESRPGEWFSLTFIEGHVPDNQQWFSTAQVRQAGQLLRTFHEAMVRAFPSDGDSLVGHGDPSPMNVVFRNGRPSALIDFAQVKMVHRMDELAYAAWMWCLSSREYWPGIDEQAFNVAHMLDGYGVPSEARAGFAARMLQVQEAAGAQWGMNGTQGHIAPERSSDMVRWVTREHNYLSHHVGVFQAVLEMHVPGAP